MGRFKTIFLAFAILLVFTVVCLAGIRFFSARSSENIEPRKQATTGTVTGFVVTGVPKIPVAGAIVTIGDKTAKTDHNGRFLLMELPVSTHAVSVASGASSWKGSVTVVKGGTVTIPEITLPPN